MERKHNPIRLIPSAMGDARLETFLIERLREHNAAAIGHNDVECFSAACNSDDGAIVAGITGFTWGGCCYVSYLWVAAPERGKGLGRDLLRAAENHALARRCRRMLLCSHTFQAPSFYMKQGYQQIARIDDYPLGHADIFLAKRLHPER